MQDLKLSALAYPSAAAQRSRRLVAGFLALLLVFAAWQWFTPGPPPAPRPGPDAGGQPPPDPRLTFVTPYLNVRPEVRYVGDAECARCHSGIASTFHEHPMGRSSPVASSLVGLELGALPAPWDPLPGSFGLAARLGALECYEASVRNPFQAQGRTYRVERRGPHVYHSEVQTDAAGKVVAAAEAPVLMAIGSGARGRSYVIDRDGYLFQSPISWYSHTHIWDLSPGYEKRNQHFERPIGDHCLFCHTNRAEPVEGTINRFRAPIAQAQGIGCERCHGPGELHVASRERGEDPRPDYTIVNPTRLPPHLRDAVCEQCHITGEQTVLRAGRRFDEYRPGLPLYLFWSVFVLPEEMADQHKSVTTVEQMHFSRCFQKSNGKLGCISCHDPHELPTHTEAASFYRSRCLQCHAVEPGGTAAPSGKGHVKACSQKMQVRRREGDRCTDCHMKRLSSSTIPHAANTDHRVLKLAEPEDTPETQRVGASGGPPLVHIHGKLLDPGDAGPARDLAIALVQGALKIPEPSQRITRAEQALPGLNAALQAWPDDVAAREARAGAFALLGRGRQALEEFDAALARAPRREQTLVSAATLAGQLGLRDKALEYWRRAMAVNPHVAHYDFEVAKLHRDRQEWSLAADACRQGLRLRPFDLDARKLLLQCYVKLQDKDRARSELEIVLGFDLPEPDRKALRDWFADAVREQ
jgi:Tfp pilus assembly protein PilF